MKQKNCKQADYERASNILSSQQHKQTQNWLIAHTHAMTNHTNHKQFKTIQTYCNVSLNNSIRFDSMQFCYSTTIISVAERPKFCIEHEHTQRQHKHDAHINVASARARANIRRQTNKTAETERKHDMQSDCSFPRIPSVTDLGRIHFLRFCWWRDESTSSGGATREGKVVHALLNGRAKTHNCNTDTDQIENNAEKIERGHAATSRARSHSPTHQTKRAAQTDLPQQALECFDSFIAEVGVFHPARAIVRAPHVRVAIIVALQSVASVGGLTW